MGNARYEGRDWIAALSFIQRGRSGTSRRFSKTRQLRFVGPPDADGNCAIALRLHQTDIVTYNLDGTQTIWMGGWNTVTTKSDINAHSVARIYGLSSRQKRLWGYDRTDEVLGVFHADDPLAAPRVQKCRVCHGRGINRFWCKPREQYHYHRWSQTPDEVWGRLPVRWSTVREPTKFELERLAEEKPALYGGSEWTADLMVRERHSHRRPDQSRLELCHHEMAEPHTWEEPCYRCDGTGRVDFGSDPVPWAFTPTDQITVDATGKVITEEDMIAATRRGLIDLRRRMRRRPVED